MKTAIKKTGNFFAHKERIDQIICIFKKTNCELLGFPFQVEQTAEGVIFTIITLYRVTKGELEAYQKSKNLNKEED